MALAVSTARFETNDDVQILTTLNGASPGFGIAQTFFLNAGVGRVLSRLYQATPAIEWYGVWLVFIAVLSGLALWYVMDRWASEHGRRARLLAALAASCATLTCLVVLQYTRVGILAGVSGGFVLISGVCDRPMSGRRRMAQVLAGTGLVCLGFAARDQAALLGAGLAALVLPAAIQRQDSIARKLSMQRGALAVLLVAACLATLVTIDARSYRAPEWQAGKRTFAVSRPFTDYHLHRKICSLEACASIVGTWSANDIRLLDDFIYDDSVAFGLDRLESAQARLFPSGTSALERLRLRAGPLLRYPIQRESDGPRPSYGPQHTAPRPPQLAEQGSSVAVASAPVSAAAQTPAAILGRQLGGAFGSAEFSLFFLTTLLLLLGGSRTVRLTTTLTAASMAALFVMMGMLTKSPPAWVSQPYWLLGALDELMIVWLLHHVANLRRWPVALLSAAMVVFGVVHVAREVTTARRLDAQRSDFLSLGIPNNTPIITVLMSAPTEALWRPLGGNGALHAFRWIHLGWLTGTPVQSAARARAELLQPMFVACDPRALLFAGSYHAQLLQIFAEQHAGCSCAFERAYPGSALGLWRAEASCRESNFAPAVIGSAGSSPPM
jgi:hypothetical protein